MIERLRIDPKKERDRWLALRRNDVTASAAAALVGAHEYFTAYELAALKSGRVDEDRAENAAMRRGRLLEPVCVQILREDHPHLLIEEPNLYVRDADARLGCTPDLFVTDKDGRFGVVQIKTVDDWPWRQKWRDADTGEVKTPVWIAVQAIIEAHLCGADFVQIAAFHGMNMAYELVDVPLHAGIIEKVRAETAAFWTMLDAGKMPDPDFKRDGDVIRRMFEPEGESEGALPDDFLPLVLERERIAAGIKSSTERKKEIEAQIIHALGNHSIATCGDYRVSFKSVHRKGYAVAAQTVRQFNVRAIKEKSK